MKVAVFVIGPDRPGIIAAVSQTLFEQGCNLEDVSQTTLQEQFVGIFLAATGEGARVEDLGKALRGSLDPMGLFVHLREVSGASPGGSPGEPFVITTIGPDRPGLVAGVTAVLAGHGVNITNLKAFCRTEGGAQEYVVFYEADIPPGTDHRCLRADLGKRARELGLDVNLQHREIFEHIHRI